MPVPATKTMDLIRSVRFDVAAEGGDDLTLEGYAAVFDTPTRIDSWEGQFDEQIQRGAFKNYLEDHMPVLMFEHGHHPLVGCMPLGVIQEATEDARGLHIVARLTDNWLIQPVRDAVRDGAIDGMSFRFKVRAEKWEDQENDIPLRTLLELDVPELGPVVFPAYEPTTVSVRSILDGLPNQAGRSVAGSTEGGSKGAERMSYDHLVFTRHLERTKH